MLTGGSDRGKHSLRRRHYEPQEMIIKMNDSMKNRNMRPLPFHHPKTIFHQRTRSSITYPIPSQEAGTTLVSVLESRVSMSNDDHLYTLGGEGKEGKLRSSAICTVIYRYKYPYGARTAPDEWRGTGLSVGPSGSHSKQREGLATGIVRCFD
ncbi:hypothetical protein EVAR_25652_1 [Eumeta japonica]|uniref:Uncharacterized protein n=1 Tax=Eumeta variegata TaxID=151549 RepID=A0A4C1WF11_EUMVA|nr:hypothetical protein EVAR_25652_1 [Eumeta japonica]